ncbi:hypothetical protein MG293_010260 [Ovis ammon polii]|uniref:Uncharacterized protein n=1 Tax=Ovis ammon polii TaxID=230172 RepID=A0AAD4U950_OVIAM|nr:hypothetical protein MG293_010260 [Ovis ammon polii]
MGSKESTDQTWSHSGSPKLGWMQKGQEVEGPGPLEWKFGEDKWVSVTKRLNRVPEDYHLASDADPRPMRGPPQGTHTAGLGKADSPHLKQKLKEKHRLRSDLINSDALNKGPAVCLAVSKAHMSLNLGRLPRMGG